MSKIKTSFTLPIKIKTLIILLSRKFGVSQTAIVQMAIVKLAEIEKIEVD